jgi:hypothetical protein
MTVTQILLAIAPKKPMTRETLYTHLRALRIKPVSRVRQIPQLYPEDTADRVLKRLGFTPGKVAKRNRRQLVAA